MRKSTDSYYMKILIILLFVVPANAQSLSQNEESCRGPVFSARELSRPARIISRQIPTMTPEALAHDVHGRVVLEAVLCRTGQVTDLQIIESLPYGMTEKSLEAVRQIEFTPAEMNWHTVSQRMRFEFYFNERGVEEIVAKDAEGLIVQRVEIVGNRRLTGSEILALINTRPGSLCSVEQLKKDLASILATGYFDTRNTRVQTQKTADGLVVIVFEVHELPIIGAVRFEGLRRVAESTILSALLKQGIDLREGQVYDPEKVRSAIPVILKALASNGSQQPAVGVRTKTLTSTSVELTFVITAK